MRKNIIFIIISLLSLFSVLILVNFLERKQKNVGNPHSSSEMFASEYPEITLDTYLEKMGQEDILLFIGKKSCSTCPQMEQILEKLAKKYVLNIYYVDIMKSDHKSVAYNKFIAMDSSIYNNIGYTPMLVLTEKNNFVDTLINETAKKNVETFFKTNEVRSK